VTRRTPGTSLSPEHEALFAALLTVRTPPFHSNH
jgi:hypothetical protein